MTEQLKIPECLSRIKCLFLDTAPLIYYVEAHPFYLPKVGKVFEQIDSGLLTCVTSPITLSECLILPCRLKSQELAQKFSDLILGGNNTVFIPLMMTSQHRLPACELDTIFHKPMLYR